MIKKILKKIILFSPFKIEFFFDNVASPLFGISKKFKNITESNIKSFGNFNKNKTFYVIKRTPGAGLFSNLTFVLNHLLICKNSGFIPVVDMENFPTIYNEKNKIFNTFNAWLYYFKPLNNYSLKEIYKSKNVIFSESNFQKKMSLDMTNKKVKFFFKKIKINKKFITRANKYYKSFFNKKDRVLGVHFRGSTYKVARGHAFPPTTNLMVKNIDYLMKKYKYNKIFVVTEEQNYLDILKKKYKNNCFYQDSYRMKKIDSFKIYPRKNHRYKLGQEILLETLLLAKCDGLSYIKSNVISAAICLSKKKQKYHEIFLGYNSRNKYIARWLWYIKKLFPENFGGLKIKEKNI